MKSKNKGINKIIIEIALKLGMEPKTPGASVLRLFHYFSGNHVDSSLHTVASAGIQT